ncbi:MAG TPA: hypothetical protein K8V35_03500 [Aliicoccus persicus]|uniref:Antitoxin n=1 Tax=Aliicoccus persicus TaxID=930138 RepID=A0A921B710_9STAP|nr:hypothetical protein [Aliicoccus persicus]
MEVLKVPYKSISEVKRSPMSAFKEAAASDNAVYILNRNEVAGVMLTQEQYEGLNAEIDKLYERIDEMIIKSRLEDKNTKTYSVKEVTGVSLDDIKYDEDDGWE